MATHYAPTKRNTYAISCKNYTDMEGYLGTPIG